MERLLVIWCPRLLEEREDGREARAFLQVLGAAAAFSPAAAGVRPGVCAVPTRGPSRYFGGDRRLAQLLCHSLAEVEEAGIGVADGLFAAVLAARAAGAAGPVVVPPGKSPDFLAPWPVETLERPELADLLRRLGIGTLGAFAALPARHVLGRLGTEGAVCHEVARGTRSELPGFRLVPRRRAPGGAGHGQPGTGTVRQAGFWGGAAAAEARATLALARLEQLVEPEGLVVGRLQGGRGPVERVRLVPWVGRRLHPAAPGLEPWPGRLPPPAPAVVLERKLPATVVDGGGAELEVSAAGLPSAAPQQLSVAGGPWQAVVAWAGPWPVDERWWSGRGRRRRARMQLVAEGGMAYLVVRQDAGWWVEGAYD